MVQRRWCTPADTALPGMSQINRPKAHRPELVNTETPISQEQKMRQALGLGKEDGAGSGDDEPESPTPVPPKPKKRRTKLAQLEGAILCEEAESSGGRSGGA